MSKGQTDTPPSDMSEQEWLDQTRGVSYNQEMAEEIAGHFDEGPQAPESPHAPRRMHGRRGGPIHATGDPDRLFRSEVRGEQHREPSPGSPMGVPTYPGPLYTREYPGKDPALGHPPLDVGPANAYYSGGMAHGVIAPPQHGGRPSPKAEERALLEANLAPMEVQFADRVEPIPVYQVEIGTGGKPLRRSVLKRVAVPATGGQPVPVCGKDPHRISVRLLNESSTAIRLLVDPVNPGGASNTQDTGNGIILPASQTSYLEIRTQDQLWAIADSGASILYVSIVLEYQLTGGH